MSEQDLKNYLDDLKNELLNYFEKNLAKQSKQLLTLKEAAEHLGVSYNTFQKFRYEGLKVFEIDGTKRVHKVELDKFIEQHSYKIGG